MRVLICSVVRKLLRFGTAAALGLAAIVLVLGAPAQAGRLEAPDIQATPYPAGQQATPVTPSTPDDPYPPAGQPTSPPVLRVTLTLTPTQAPDVFRTEDAEISGSQSTPAASDTPGPTITPANTSTSTPTVTSTIEIVVPNQGNNTAAIDWGWFWMGFAIPILAACGFVLYLLDRRPDFFKPRPKST